MLDEVSEKTETKHQNHAEMNRSKHRTLHPLRIQAIHNKPQQFPSPITQIQLDSNDQPRSPHNSTLKLRSIAKSIQSKQKHGNNMK